METLLRRAVVVILFACTLIAACDRPSTTSEFLGPVPQPLGEVHGRVVATEDGQPISGATVTITGTPFVTLTDATGRYRFADLPVADLSSPVRLRAFRDGFTPQLRETPLEDGASVTIDFALPRRLEPPPPPAPMPSGSVRVQTFTTDVVGGCIAAGDRLEFVVEVANEGTAPVQGVVLYDTLDASFGRHVTPADVVVDRAEFPEAKVVLGDDGRSFRVELGTLAPGPPTPVYTVALPAATSGGVYCNTVTARAGNAFLDYNVGCVTTTLAIEVDIANEDGAVANGSFMSEKDVFRVGDGSAARPDELVFRVVVTNANCFTLGSPLGGVRVRSVIAPGGQIIEFRAAIAGYPDYGTLEEAGPSGFTWRIGLLSPGARAELRFRAEAVRSGQDVHRIELAAAQFTGSIVSEETITVLP